MPNAFDALTDIPARIYVGDDVVWSNEGLISDYPIATHSFEVRLQPHGGGEVITVSHADVNGVPTFTLTGVQTKRLGAGPVSWSLAVIRAADSARRTIDTGEMIADPKPGAGYDLRSKAQRDYDAVCAVIDGRITKDVESYSIDGRSLTRIPIGELRAIRRALVRQINRENGHSGGKAHKAWG